MSEKLTTVGDYTNALQYKVDCWDNMNKTIDVMLDEHDTDSEAYLYAVIAKSMIVQTEKATKEANKCNTK